MTWLHEQDVAIPKVRGVDGNDLVTDHIASPTMLEHLEQWPWLGPTKSRFDHQPLPRVNAARRLGTNVL